MKRRRPFTPRILRIIAANAYWGEAIPPRSEVKLLSPWNSHQYRNFRIGYYSRLDGLNCVWLVNEPGEYQQATDQASIREDFELLSRSDETDLYGTSRLPLKPVGS